MTTYNDDINQHLEDIDISRLKVMKALKIYENQGFAASRIEFGIELERQHILSILKQITQNKTIQTSLKQREIFKMICKKLPYDVFKESDTKIIYGTELDNDIRLCLFPHLSQNTKKVDQTVNEIKSSQTLCLAVRGQGETSPLENDGVGMANDLIILEKQTEELIDIFSDISLLLVQQMPDIETISHNVDSTKINTEIATKDLVKAEVYQRQTYGKYIIICGITLGSAMGYPVGLYLLHTKIAAGCSAILCALGGGLVANTRITDDDD